MKSALALLREHKAPAAVAAALLLLLVGPFLLRPADAVSSSRYDKRLVIMTPHHEAIRQEFGAAFVKHWRETKGQMVYLDWRAAGTSELAMILKSDFTAAFESHWTGKLGQPWTHDALSEFLNPKSADHKARQAFLSSDVSIGVDLFFGGGPPDFISQAELGTLIATDSRTGAGLPRLMQQRPEWFTDAAIPSSVSGEVFRDAQHRWCGTALSSFGIVFNRDVLRRLGVTAEPTQWTDLANPVLIGQVALADPTKSGSVNKAFEMLVQQQMHAAEAKLQQRTPRLAPAEESLAAAQLGWSAAMNLIKRISANARYFTDSAPKIPLEVSRGDAAAGMCIDFHGRSAQEMVKQLDGSSRVGFVSPVGGTSVAVDPIAMLRGAPEPELAEAFIDFVLSDAGQKLWCYRKGQPGAPFSESLRRLPVRKDLYTAEHRAMMADPEEEPFVKAQSFIYRPEWTGSVFNVLRFVIRVACVDTHHEQRQAWKAIVEHGFPAEAVAVFDQIDAVSYDYAKGELNQILRSRDKVREVQEARRLSELFRRQYEVAKNLAEQASGK
jgi:iron(III) transport system substrate-binding protein